MGNLGLEEAQVYDRRAAMVLTFDVLHPLAFDPEDRHPLAAKAADFDVSQFAASHEPEGSKEEVFRLQHRGLPRLHARSTDGGEFG